MQVSCYSADSDSGEAGVPEALRFNNLQLTHWSTAHSLNSKDLVVLKLRNHLEALFNYKSLGPPLQLLIQVACGGTLKFSFLTSSQGVFTDDPVSTPENHRDHGFKH